MNVLANISALKRNFDYVCLVFYFRRLVLLGFVLFLFGIFKWVLFVCLFV